MGTVLTPFPAARYRLDFTIASPLHLHDYAGSALRGAFGRALRQSVCVTRQPDCKACMLYRSCVYPEIFAPPPVEHRLQKFAQIPAPYVVEPPAWGARTYAVGETFSFHFVLIGRALRHLPIAVHAWQRALGHGIGPEDGTARLERVALCNADAAQVVYDAAQGQVREHTATLSPPPALAESVTLEFTTALRLQDSHGKALGDSSVDARRLLIGLAKRVSLLDEFHGTATRAPDFPAPDFPALVAATAKVSEERRLRWRSSTRYSSRQRQEMELAGLVGHWRLDGDLAPFWPYLHWGQWLHVGKNASFGLGQYRLLN